MSLIKTEEWNGNNIRFVEKGGEWWAVLKDICDVLELETRKVRERLEDDLLSRDVITDKIGRKQEMLIVNEIGVYKTIFQSRKKEAVDFQKWAYEMLKTLRQASGLEGFQVFRTLDKEHQKEMMAKLRNSLSEPKRVDFIKANTIANKAVSTKYGFPKMVKKGDMSPDMLTDREALLGDTVELMGVKEKYHLTLSVSDEVYKRVAAR